MTWKTRSRNFCRRSRQFSQSIRNFYLLPDDKTDQIMTGFSSSFLLQGLSAGVLSTFLLGTTGCQCDSRTLPSSSGSEVSADGGFISIPLTQQQRLALLERDGVQYRSTGVFAYAPRAGAPLPPKGNQIILGALVSSQTLPSNMRQGEDRLDVSVERNRQGEIVHVPWTFGRGGEIPAFKISALAAGKIQAGADEFVRGYARRFEAVRSGASCSYEGEREFPLGHMDFNVYRRRFPAGVWESIEVGATRLMVRYTAGSVDANPDCRGVAGRIPKNFVAVPTEGPDLTPILVVDNEDAVGRPYLRTRSSGG